MNNIVKRLDRNKVRYFIRQCSTKDKPEKTDETAGMSRDLVENTNINSAIDLEEMKKNRAAMKWRTPWHEKEGQHFDALRSFYSEHNNIVTMKFLQTPFDLRPSSIKQWWLEKKEFKAAYLQSYIPDRNRILGNELAAAHFVVHRGGAIKFYGENHWIKADDRNNYSLPRTYDSSKILQAIDCTDMQLYFEGLANFRDLENVEWLSLNSCEKLDDWALDRISNIFSHSLLYLDLRGLPLITHRGIGALYKMQNLKILYVDNDMFSTEFEMTCLILEHLNKDLQIHIEN